MKGYKAVRKQRQASRVDAEGFVTIWQKAADVQEVAKKIGSDPMTASVRAAHYRKLGIPLKRFSRARPKLDVAGLAALARRWKKS